MESTVGSENQLPNYTKCKRDCFYFFFSLLKLMCNCVKIKSENFLMAHNCHFASQHGCNINISKILTYLSKRNGAALMKRKCKT